MAYNEMAMFYDRFMRDMPYTRWIDWTYKMWNEGFGQLPLTAAELGCGTGNITIPLALSGVGMTGIDLSEDMLALAQIKWENETKRNQTKGQAQWLHQDMTAFHLASPVESIIAYCDSFNYLLDEQELEGAFRSAFEGLCEGGMLLFDMLPKQRFETYAELQPFVVDEGDLSYYWFCEYDESSGVIEHDITFFLQEKRNLYQKMNEIHTQKAYEPNQVVQMLRKIGFREAACMTNLFPESEALADRMFFKAVK